MCVCVLERGERSRERKRKRKIDLPIKLMFVGHFKGTELLRKCYSTTAAAVTMTAAVEMDSSEVTPERRRLVTLNSGSVSKRKLKLEDGSSCKPQTKRRRTLKRDSSGSSGKKLPAMLGYKENSRQRTMHSYFQPA